MRDRFNFSTKDGDRTEGKEREKFRIDKKSFYISFSIFQKSRVKIYWTKLEEYLYYCDHVNYGSIQHEK